MKVNASNIQEAGKPGWNTTLLVPSLARQGLAPTLLGNVKRKAQLVGMWGNAPRIPAGKHDGTPAST